MDKPKAPVAVAENIWWVGALDPELKRFDVVMTTDYGSSYNAYIVKGTEKTVLIDTVKEGFEEESLALIRQIVAPEDIDFIIMQHTEPDHSGAIAAFRKACPKAKIYASKPASMNIPFIAGEPVEVHAVTDGEKLDLGGRTLTFVSAPFLHWPDTIFTYDDLTESLFTCDAFGCHFAEPRILESRTNGEFKGARRYYYDCIVSPFGKNVQNAIKKLGTLNLPVKAILTSHGPVLDADPAGAIALYDEWSKEIQAVPKTAFVGYVSCYGYTKQLAERMASELEALGWKVNLKDVSLITPEEAASAIYSSEVVALGTPTVNADALPPIWYALAHVSVPIVRGKKAVVFGSFGWSGEAQESVAQRLTSLGFKVAGTYRTRFRPTDESFEEIKKLAAALVG